MVLRRSDHLVGAAGDLHACDHVEAGVEAAAPERCLHLGLGEDGADVSHARADGDRGEHAKLVRPPCFSRAARRRKRPAP